MPSIDANRANWNDPGNWRDHGEEWSQAWGGTANLWFGTLLPRLHAWLPAAHLLEIACGHGRITAHLLPLCARYTGVDLAPDCVARCRERFAGSTHATFLATDGRSLAGVGDASVDFACSWDSLVHAERDAIDGYLAELARVLRPGGFAWLHHSNLGAFAGADGKPSVPNRHWRASSVSAASVVARAVAVGLHCVAQELLQWGDANAIDCISVLRRPHAGDPPPERREHGHPDFNAELAHFRALAAHYTTTPTPPARS
jgi:SAM-dependent methyltransferase